MSVKERQLNVRLTPATDQWLEQAAHGKSHKADYVRALIEEDMRRQQEAEELAMFSQAARDLTPEDGQERDRLLNAYSNRDDTT